MFVKLNLFWISLLAATCLNGQTKEELYNIHTLGTRNPNDPEAVAGHWTYFGLKQIDNLKFYPEYQHVREELESILAPIIELRKIASENPNDEVMRELKRLSSNDQTASAIFEVLGPEYCTRIIQNDARLYLERRRQDDLMQWHEFKSELQIEGFAKSLGLDDAQKKRIEAAVGQASSDYQQRARHLLDEISSLSSGRWRELLRVLNSTQRKLAETRIGGPIDWHRDLHKQHKARAELGRLSRNGYWRVGQNALDLSIAGSEDDKVAALQEMSDDQLKEHRLIRMNPVVYDMFFNDEVWDALELVDQQRKEIVARKQRFEQSDIFVISDPNRFDELIAGDATLPDLIIELLLPDQIDLFLQIELQVRTDEEFDSTVGLLDPRIVSKWKIDQQQSKELERIGNEFQSAQKALLVQLAELRKKIETDLEQKLALLLNDEQKSVYKTFTGKEITKESKSPPNRAPKGGQ